MELIHAIADRPRVGEERTARLGQDRRAAAAVEEVDGEEALEVRDRVAHR